MVKGRKGNGRILRIAQQFLTSRPMPSVVQESLSVSLLRPRVGSSRTGPHAHTRCTHAWLGMKNLGHFTNSLATCASRRQGSATSVAQPTGCAGFQPGVPAHRPRTRLAQQKNRCSRAAPTLPRSLAHLLTPCSLPARSHARTHARAWRRERSARTRPAGFEPQTARPKAAHSTLQACRTTKRHPRAH